MATGSKAGWWILLVSVGIASCTRSHPPPFPCSALLQSDGKRICLVTERLVIEGGFECPPELSARLEMVGGVLCSDHPLRPDELPADVCMHIDCTVASPTPPGVGDAGPRPSELRLGNAPDAGPAIDAEVAQAAGAELVVLWGTVTPDGTLAHTLPSVHGAFPTAFTLDPDMPPLRDDYLYPIPMADGGPRISEGYLAAVRAGALQEPDIAQRLGAAGQDESVLGWVERYGLIYVSEDVPPGGEAERYLCGALPAGYYLMVGDRAPSGPEVDCPLGSGSGWIEAAEGFDTVLTVSLSSGDF